MNKIKLLTLGVLMATSASAVQAANDLTLGAGVGVIQHPYKQYSSDVVPVPVLNYEGDNFWFRGLGGGYYLWNDGTDQVSVMAYWLPTYFKPSDSDSRQLRRLDSRHSTMMAGLSWMHHTQYGSLRTSLSGDTLDKNNGLLWDLAWIYRYTNGGLTLTPGIGVEWNSDNMNDYYYGVSHKESRKSGLRDYSADGGWNPYLELTANYRFLGNWSVYGTARYTRLSDEITDSPMVDKSWTGLLSTGITYKF